MQIIHLIFRIHIVNFLNNFLQQSSLKSSTLMKKMSSSRLEIDNASIYFFLIAQTHEILSSPFFSSVPFIKDSILLYSNSPFSSSFKTNSFERTVSNSLWLSWRHSAVEMSKKFLKSFWSRSFSSSTFC